MICNCSFIWYHIWLFRKRHVFLTLCQIVVPVLIIMLFTYDWYQLHIKQPVRQSNQLFTEQILYDSVPDPACTNRVQTITYYSSPTEQTLAQTVINKLKSTYFQNYPSLQFVQVPDEDEIIRVAVIHHALDIAPCYIGGIVFLHIPNPETTFIRASDGLYHYLGDYDGDGEDGRMENKRPLKSHSNYHPDINNITKILSFLTKSNSNSSRDLSNAKNNNNAKPRVNPNAVFNVKIRMASFIPREIQSTLTHTLYFDPDFPRVYTAFLGIQLALSKVFMSMLDDAWNKTVNSSTLLANKPINLQEFPFPNLYRTFPISDQVQPLYSIVTITLVLSQTAVVFSLVRGTAYDKETGFRTYLTLMGLRRVTYWIIWFLNELIIRLVVGALEIAFFFSDFYYQAPSLVQRGDITVWAAFIFVYNLASISFLVFIASFCKRGVFSVYKSVTIWLLSYYFGDLFLSTPYFYLQYHISKLLMCLNPNSALILALRIMTTQIGGMQWHTLMFRPDQNGLTLLEIMAILIFDVFFYFILTIYIDLLAPGSYSVKFWHHWRLIWQVRCKAFWRRRQLTLLRLIESETSMSATSAPIEQNDIVFANVSMKYGHHYNALLDCNFRAQDKSHTAIIAHEGSGKTTMARLICGTFPPTSGQVLVAGREPATNKSLTTKVLSFCPDENMLCYYFTVIEHLMLIGRLRGQRSARVRRKVKEILTGLEMNDYAHHFPGDLVHNQKRKLCIAMSLIGKSEMILMDNPTRNMDSSQMIPIAKFIRRYCFDKTLVFFTPSLVEAYTFADRIAILSTGRILGAGTKTQLESCLKIGYHLHLVFHPLADSNAIINSLRKHMPQLEILDAQSTRIQKTLELVEMQALSSSSLENHRRLTGRTIKGSHSHSQSNIRHGRGASGRQSTVSVTFHELPTINHFPTSRDSSILVNAGSATAPAGFGKLSGFAIERNHSKQTLDSLGLGLGLGDQETEYPNFDDMIRTPSNSSMEGCTLYLPKLDEGQFQNFFQSLATESAKDSKRIETFSLAPYTMQNAYEELEEYMKLKEAKDSFDIKSADEITEINSKFLGDHLDDRLHLKLLIGIQRFKSQIYKRFSYHWSNGLWSLFQFGLPLILICLAVSATQHSFFSHLSGPIVENTLAKFVNPVAMIKYIDGSLTGFVALYKDEIIPAKSYELDQTETFQDVIQNVGVRGSRVDTDFAASYVIGLDVNASSSTAMFSPIAFHAAPSSLSILVNTHLRSIYPGYSIQISSQSIQHKKKEILKFYLKNLYRGFDFDPAASLAIIFTLGFFLFTSFFIVPPITENVVMLKRMQLNTGLSTLSYWLSFVLTDFLHTAVFSVAILMIVVWLPQHDTFRNYEFMFYCYNFLVLAGVSCIVQCYAFSFIFMQPKTSIYAMMSYNQVSGLFLYILNSFFYGLQGTILTFSSRLFQPFNVPSGFYNLFTIAIERSRCRLMSRIVREAICRNDTDWDSSFNFGLFGNRIDRACCSLRLNTWFSLPINQATVISGQGQSLGYLRLRYQNNKEFFDDLVIDFIFLAIHFLVSWIFILGIEMGLYRKWFPKYLEQSEMDFLVNADGSVTKMPLEEKETPSDSDDLNINNKDVKATRIETERKKTPVNTMRFTVQGITRKYFFESRKVLHDISFVAQPGDLYGIVGPSKSGKTVLLEILARFQKPTKGSVFFGYGGGKLTKDFSYLEKVGYKPHKNILKENQQMKGVTFLRLFARLRGVPERQVNNHVDKWSKLFGLEKYKHVRCEYYPASVRNRFALAMAFIGDPPILLLDEPLKYLDPFSKRQFWIITEYLRSNIGTIIILTTTHVADLEPHCSKIGILVNGELQCLMKPATLKETYGGGFILHIEFQEGATFLHWMTVKNRISYEFPNSVLHQEQSKFVEYKIQQDSFSSQSQLRKPNEGKNPNSDSEVVLSASIMWSSILTVMQEMMSDYSHIISEYYVSEETLQHIYDSFARKQRPYNKPRQTREEFCMRYC